MLFATTKDIWYFVASVCIFAISVFLVWALYEIARLVHHANQMVKETQHKIERFEAALISIGERFASVSRYMGFIAEGAKQVFTYVRKRNHKKELEEELAELDDEEGESETDKNNCK